MIKMLEYVWENKLEGFGRIPFDSFSLKLILCVDSPSEHILLLIEFFLLFEELSVALFKLVA
jgi:hypothetical protein